MQAKKRFVLVWLIALLIVIMCLLKTARKSDNLLHLTYNVNDAESLPSFMDDWQQNLEVGRPPAAKTYEARQQMPFRSLYRKTNKNCRLNKINIISEYEYLVNQFMNSLNTYIFLEWKHVLTLHGVTKTSEYLFIHYPNLITVD